MTKHRILQTLHAGVYLHGSEPPTWRQGMRAAMLAGGPATVASHRGGAAVYGVMEPSVVEVTVPIRNDLELNGGIVHRTRRPLTKSRVINGIRVCSLERVLFDLASVCTEVEVECAVEAALRQRLTTEARLWIALVEEGGPGVPGTALFRRVLETRPKGRPARSILEVLTARLLRRRGIRDFVRNHPVEVNGDRFEIDFAFLVLKIALEVDGKAFHSTRTQTKGDIERQRKLEAAGWLFVRVGWSDVLLRPDCVIEQLRNAFADRCASKLG